VLFGPEGPVTQLIHNNRVETRRIKTGLSSGSMVEVRAGLSEGDLVVARSGTFLRDGDLVRPVGEQTGAGASEVAR
jgi:multidrug efflux pump subunit AcrA (membrane-fusion protein)